MNYLKTYFTLCLIFCLAFVANAQKFGFINSQLLVDQIPQVKEAKAELETLQQQFEKEAQDKFNNLQTQYQALGRKQDQGEISPKQLEVEAQQLEAERLKIAKFQQDRTQQLQEKSETLMNPIREMINDAIQAVAKENGFTYIFDNSTGVILYADEMTDVSDLVRAKLGIAN